MISAQFGGTTWSSPQLTVEGLLKERVSQDSTVKDCQGRRDDPSSAARDFQDGLEGLMEASKEHY
jgi:hypothetical protein